MNSRLPPSDQVPVRPDESHMMSRGERATAVIERTDYLSRQNVLLRKLLGRELMRRGKQEEVYTAIEIDHAIPATVESDGKGNSLVTLES